MLHISISLRPPKFIATCCKLPSLPAFVILSKQKSWRSNSPRGATRFKHFNYYNRVGAPSFALLRRVGNANPHSHHFRKCSSHTTQDNPYTSTSAVTEMIVSHTDHVLIVSETLMFKYSFTSQKPPSLTCEKISDPAPVAIANSSG